jgi:hypothetical protein
VIRRFVLAGAAAALLSAFTCSKRAAVDMPDKDVPPPTMKQLEAWEREYKEGTTWRGDPLRLAHEEIKNWLDVPWKGEPFNPARYEFTESNPEKPQWGSYVIRRYVDDNGRMTSYQVQMSRHNAIWYARKIRHYFSIEMNHPALEDKEKRRH